MKRVKSFLVVILCLVLTVLAPAPVLASSLGVSPPSIDVVVPSGGACTVDFQVYYFTGDVQVAAVDIPVSVEPSSFVISSSPDTISVRLQDISGSVGEYNGYIRFSIVGSSVSLAVSVKAKVTVQLIANIAPVPSGDNGAMPPVAVPAAPVLPVAVTAPDERVSLSIPADTVIHKADGTPVSASEITVTESVSPPPAPEALNVIGLAYDFEPSGIIFDTPIELVFTYDDMDIPEGVSESDLVVAFYDESLQEWVELDCVVDVETNTITASVSHFTAFAVLCHRPAATPVVEKPEPEIKEPAPEVLTPTPGTREPIAPEEPGRWQLVVYACAILFIVAVCAVYIGVRRSIRREGKQ